MNRFSMAVLVGAVSIALTGCAGSLNRTYKQVLHDNPQCANVEYEKEYTCVRMAMYDGNIGLDAGNDVKLRHENTCLGVAKSLGRELQATPVIVFPQGRDRCRISLDYGYQLRVVEAWYDRAGGELNYRIVQSGKMGSYDY